MKAMLFSTAHRPLTAGIPHRPPRQAKFTEQQQALLHGDLHTGSIMATGALLLAAVGVWAAFGCGRPDCAKQA